MSDIRKRTGKKGTTYQVRYPNSAAKCGYSYKSFDTMKEARAFLESGLARKTGATGGDRSIRTVPQAVNRHAKLTHLGGL